MARAFILGVTAQEDLRPEVLPDSFGSASPGRIGAPGHHAPPTGTHLTGLRPLGVWLWLPFLGNSKKPNSSHSAAVG